MALLKIENICYSYDKRRNVLSNISFDFEAGTIYAIVGKSGSGKTTMLSLLSGLAEPVAGKIYYKDQDVAKINMILGVSLLVLFFRISTCFQNLQR